MGDILPRIPKNNPPQGRTEFEGLTDLLKYISEEKESTTKSTPLNDWEIIVIKNWMLTFSESPEHKVYLWW